MFEHTTELRPMPSVGVSLLGKELVPGIKTSGIYGEEKVFGFGHNLDNFIDLRTKIGRLRGAFLLAQYAYILGIDVAIGPGGIQGLDVGDFSARVIRDDKKISVGVYPELEALSYFYEHLPTIWEVRKESEYGWMNLNLKRQQSPSYSFEELYAKALRAVPYIPSTTLR